MSHDTNGPATPETLRRGITVTDASVASVIKMPEPSEPLLSFYMNADGKVDAKYEPEDLTDAARILITEVRQLQGLKV